MLLLAVLAVLSLSGCAGMAEVQVHNNTSVQWKTIAWSGYTKVDYTTTNPGYYTTLSVPKGTYDFYFYIGSNTLADGHEDGYTVSGLTKIYLSNNTSGSGTKYLYYFEQ